MKAKFFLIILSIWVFQSCKVNNRDIDGIIEKYNQEDFSCLKGVFVNFRGGEHKGLVVLLISKTNYKCSPYIVTVNKNDGKVTKIDDTLPKRDCNGYFSVSEIETFVRCFLKYNFQVLSVDSDGNVYMNPSRQDLPIFLRKEQNKTPKDMKDFKAYKGNWYIRK